MVAEKKEKLSLSKVLEFGQDHRSRIGVERQMHNFLNTTATVQEGNELRVCLEHVDRAQSLFKGVNTLPQEQLDIVLDQLSAVGLSWPVSMQKKLLGRRIDQLMKNLLSSAGARR